MKAFTGYDKQEDDISLVEVKCVAVEEQLRESVPEKAQPLALTPWTMSWRLSVEEIRKENPIPQIIAMIGEAVGVASHKDIAYTILSEIYSNSLEHGILGLSSQHKMTDDGFLEYYKLREQRLAALDEATIEIIVQYIPDQQHTLVFSVTDSGKGFDYKTVEDQLDSNSFGRGMSLITSLSQSVKYSNEGKTIEVVYSLELE